MGGSYMFLRNASANLREKDDYWNPTIGGFFAGAVLGTRCKPAPSPGSRSFLGMCSHA